MEEEEETGRDRSQMRLCQNKLFQQYCQLLLGTRYRLRIARRSLDSSAWRSQQKESMPSPTCSSAERGMGGSRSSSGLRQREYYQQEFEPAVRENDVILKKNPTKKENMNKTIKKSRCSYRKRFSTRCPAIHKEVNCHELFKGRSKATSEIKRLIVCNN